MDAAPVTWRPLGRLLVDQGLLSDGELDRALDEQEFTGRRLGEILIDRGFLSGPRLSQALAEQYGVDLDFEREFGKRLREEIERRRQTKRPVLRIVRQDAEPEIVDVPEIVSAEEVSQLRDHAADAESRLAELLPRLEEQWARLAEAESLLDARNARIAELENGGAAGKDDLSSELETQLAEARALLVARDARFGALESELERLARSEAQLTQRNARVAELEDALAASAQPDSEPEISHLLFVPRATGYAIAEAEGPAPDLATQIHLDGSPYLVSRLGCAPFPGDRRRCAFLVA